MEKETLQKNIEIMEFVITIQTVMKVYDHKTFESGDSVLRTINSLIENKAVSLKS